MIIVYNNCVQVSGASEEVDNDFLAILASFKQWANNKYPNEPEKATDYILKTIETSFNSRGIIIEK